MNVGKRMALDKQLWDCDDEKVKRMTLIAMLEVHQTHPDANLAFVTDRAGRRLAAGIYIIPLNLNFKGQFNGRQQCAPQCLGSTLPYMDHWSNGARLRIILEAWCNAAFHLRKLSGEMVPVTTTLN